MCHCLTVKVALRSSCSCSGIYGPSYAMLHALGWWQVTGCSSSWLPGSCTGLGAAAVQPHASESGRTAALLQAPSTLQ